jgi:D-alanyl-D-alanine carboxypeptidase
MTGAEATLVLGDGSTISEKDALEIYEAPYPTGPIKPITGYQVDPGRTRLFPMLFATYGADEKAVWKALVRVPFAGHVVAVHRRIEAPFRRVATRIAQAIAKEPRLSRYFEHLGGTFNWRVIAGSKEPSSHSWGIAIDIDTSYSDYWRSGKLDAPKWRNRIPQNIVDAFEAEGFIWGGRWYYYDTMHFEYRPELIDPACRDATK